MKLRLCLLIPVIILLSSCTKSQSPNSKTPFRIVGYYPLQLAMTDTLRNIPFDKLRHINLWFLNPDIIGI
jgi:GH18 family chitinase